jgi:hypothetical protein
MTLAERWDRWRRRLFGRYSIDDPRPIAEGAPYTFFLPSENELLALSPGDHVKLLFRGNPGGKSFDVERMWVSLTDVNGNSLTGRLDNVIRSSPFAGMIFERSNRLLHRPIASIGIVAWLIAALWMMACQSIISIGKRMT